MKEARMCISGPFLYLCLSVAGLGYQSEGLGVNRFDHTKMGLRLTPFQNVRPVVSFIVCLFAGSYMKLLSPSGSRSLIVQGRAEKLIDVEKFFYRAVSFVNDYHGAFILVCTLLEPE